MNKLMKSLVFLSCIIFFQAAFAKDAELKQYFQDKWPLTNASIEYLYKGEVLTDAKVETKDAKQEFTLKAAALHPKPCKNVLRKLSMLEKYADWISFVKSSTYNEKNKMFTIRADHALLPYPMIVHIIVDRPVKPGIYPFSFPTGMFTGLYGEFIIKKHKNRCAFYAHSYWIGKKTKIPDFMVELFSETLSKLGGELLFRKTKL